MKNILKKIGVIGLTIAVLAPFIELPKVKAANTECTDHTVMQYLFLDVATGDKNDWANYEKSSGYVTYTKFANLFPSTSAGEYINILKVDTDYVNVDSLSKYYSSMKYLLDKSDNEADTRSSLGRIGTFTTKKTSTADNVRILHGSWAVGNSESSREILKQAGWYTDNSSNGETLFINSTIQSLLEKKRDEISGDNVLISAAKFSGTKFIDASDDYDNDLEKFFYAIANNEDDELTKEQDNIDYLALRIQRKLNSNNLTFGADCNDSTKPCGEGYDNKYFKFNSYENLGETPDKNSNGSIVDTRPDILTSDKIYWPVILNVEYETCPTSSNPEGENWTLKYDLNTDDDTATGKPADQTEKVGASIKVDAKKPKRDGYTFQSWNTEKDGSGTKYNPDDTFKSDGTTETKYLYAQWGKGGTTDNEKTGVVSYVIGFISVGLVATGIYLVAKKKNLFKQI